MTPPPTPSWKFDDTKREPEKTSHAPRRGAGACWCACGGGVCVTWSRLTCGERVLGRTASKLGARPSCGDGIGGMAASAASVLVACRWRWRGIVPSDGVGVISTTASRGVTVAVC
eukprot:2400000-Prymnesium_polylepis.1